MEPIISLRSAVVLLGDFPALAGADLDVRSGELLVIRGANGAGKTTLLRACAALVRLARGSGTVGGFDLVRQRAVVRQQVGLLAHDVGFYGDLSLGDNLRFWTAPAGIRDDELRSSLGRVGLEADTWAVPFSGLSAGQRRRAGLAFLVARRPRIWLLDEPHAGLDADGRDLVDELMAGAVDSGVTLLVSTHDVERVLPMATSVVTIADGVVEGGDA